MQDVDDDDVFLLPTWRLGASYVGNESSLLDCPDGLNFGFAPETFCFLVDTVELSCTSGANPGKGPPQNHRRAAARLGVILTVFCQY